MFVYFEVIRMDIDINILDEFFLYKFIILNVLVKNNFIIDINNNKNIFKKKNIISWVNLYLVSSLLSRK